MKIFKIEKKVFDDKYFDEPRFNREYRVYEVLENNIAIGKLIYKHNYCEIIIGEIFIIINRKRIFLKPDEIKIVNTQTNEQVGVILDLGMQLYNKNGKYKLDLYDESYWFDRKKPPIKYSIIKKSSWNWYNFELKNFQQSTSYSFQLNTPWLSFNKTIPSTEFSGEIKTNAKNVLVILIGIYLTELCLEEINNS